MMCDDALAQPDCLMLEQWASWLLGEIWMRRYRVTRPIDGDPMLAAGEPVVDSLAAVGGVAAKTALTALGGLARGGLAQLALAAARELSGECSELARRVGSTRIVGAYSDRCAGVGEALLLDAGPSVEVPHMVAVFIDAELGHVAKRLHLIGRVDPPTARVGADDDADRRLNFKKVDPLLACERVDEAIKRTDVTFEEPITEKFEYYRGIAVARIQPASVLT